MPSEHPASDPAFLADYGNVIRSLRTENRMERRDLAEAADISYSYLSGIESGQKLPSGKVQEALAGALGKTPAGVMALANAAPGGLYPPSDDRRAEADVGAASRHPARPSLSRELLSSSGDDLRTIRQDASPSPADEQAQGFGGPAASGVSLSGALAELNVLIPTLTPDDAAIVVSLARRLASAPSSAQRSSTDGRHPKAPGRQSRTESYLEFWTQYMAELERRGLDWGQGRRAEPRSYFTTSSPIRGSSFSASFARNRLLRHELYINRGSRTANIELLRELQENRAVIEAAYGYSLDFEDPGRERRAVRIAEYRDGHISRHDEYGDYIAWFIDRGAKMRLALAAHAESRRT